MSAQFCVQLLIVFISTPIPLILSDCLAEADNCLDKFGYDLENHKKIKFDSTESELDNICKPIDGFFPKFIECVNIIDSQCSSNNDFKNILCETRAKKNFKTRIFRFNWKPTFFYDLCHNFDRQMSQDFIHYEECISNVVNVRKWKCDFNYLRPIQAKKDWKTDLNTTCSLWQKFRECYKRDIKSNCGERASLIADNLLHSHQSYFEKYTACNLEGYANNQCWYDLIKARQSDSVGPTVTAETTTSTTTTTTVNSVTNTTDNKMDSFISSAITINDISIPTQESDVDTNVETLKDLLSGENHLNGNQKSGQLIAETQSSDETTQTSDLKSEEPVQSDNTKVSEQKISPEVKTGQIKENKGKDQQSYTSGAQTDSIADKYLITIPIVLVLILKIFV